MANQSNKINGGDAIRTRRLDLGMNQADLARMVGCGPASVARWERGECEPQARYRPKLARALQVESFSSMYNSTVEG